MLFRNFYERNNKKNEKDIVQKAKFLKESEAGIRVIEKKRRKTDDKGRTELCLFHIFDLFSYR